MSTMNSAAAATNYVLSTQMLHNSLPLASHGSNMKNGDGNGICLRILVLERTFSFKFFQVSAAQVHRTVVRRTIILPAAAAASAAAAVITTTIRSRIV